MKYFVFLLLTVGLGLSGVQAQSSVGIRVGGMALQGDLADSPFDAGQISLAYGLFYNNQFSGQFGLSVALNRGQLLADETDTDRVNRGATLSSDLTELSLQLEWHFLGAERFNVRGEFLRSFSPYIGLGIGMAFVTPEPEFRNSFDTQPEENSNSFFVIPIDLGVRLFLSPQLTATLSGGSRPVFSDLLDGVSSNGNPGADDWYLVGGLGLQYHF